MTTTITPEDISMSTLDCIPTTEDITVTAEGFIKLNLSPNLLKALAEMNFTNPSAVQAEAIPQIMTGNDIIAKAPTGSGKTAAFAIPIIERLDLSRENKNVQALVLCPTRELAIQVQREFEKLTNFMNNVAVVSVYGGQQIDKQLGALRKHPQIVVATPGRLMDHLRRGSINLESISMVVLDEADEMLDMGFRDDIHTILADTPETRQTVLFSATMAKDIVTITKKFQKNPTIVDVMDNLQSAPDIEQLYLEVSEKDKVEVLVRLLDLHNVKLALVFCNTKSNVDRVVEILKTRGYLSDSLHGDMNQAQREKVMRGFRNGGVEILVATDVAGRGIDVKNIQAVFNYDLPRDDEDYVHRIGRTARAGKSGIALTFVSKNQVQSIKRIERANGVLINKREIPTFEELETTRTAIYQEKISNIIKNSDLTEYANKIQAMVNDEQSVMDIAATLLKISMDEESKRISKQVVFESAWSEERSGRGSRGGRGGNRERSGGRFGSRNERSDRGGRGGERSERGGRGYRTERPERSEQSSVRDASVARPERAERTEYAPRPERTDYAPRAERTERPERAEYAPKTERNDKKQFSFGRDSRRDAGSSFSDGVKRKERTNQLDSMVNEARAFSSFSKKSDKPKSSVASPADKAKSFGKSYGKSNGKPSAFGKSSGKPSSFGKPFARKSPSKSV